MNLSSQYGYNLMNFSTVLNACEKNGTNDKNNQLILLQSHNMSSSSIFDNLFILLVNPIQLLNNTCANFPPYSPNLLE